MAESTTILPPLHAPPPGVALAGLRVLLFTSSRASVVLMVTSKQTVSSTVVEFTQSPALIYFVAVMSVSCLYSLITALAALTIVLKRPVSLSVSRARSLIFFLIWDVVMLGLVASAAGTAGGVAYIGWQGNKHTGWNEICKVYTTFCRNLVSSIGTSVFAGLMLLVLVALSAHSFRGCIPE